MNIEEILSSKEDLNRKIADLLTEFENQSGVAISEIRFIKRDEGTFPDNRTKYIVECSCKI